MIKKEGLTHHQVRISKVKVDIYEASRPKSFYSYCDGDMDGDSHKEDIVIKLSELPAGAKVSVEYPMCPECGDTRQEVCEQSGDGLIFVAGHERNCDCGFDWVEWENSEFS